MSSRVTRRKFMTIGAQSAAVVAMAPQFFVRDFYPQAASSEYASTFGPLDKFVEQYMREMNSPGMTFVMADKEGVQRVTTYGFSDPEIKTRGEARRTLPHRLHQQIFRRHLPVAIAPGRQT